MNYFSLKSAAERYKLGRPEYHHQTIEKIRKFFKLNEMLDVSLDLACGTGLSTVPLLNISKKVIGIDTSLEMLKLAEQNPNIEYKTGTAENTGLKNNSVDLITVASGIHWFDTEKFFTESKRLLSSKGYLVVYENYYMGGMTNHPEFSTWYKDIYLEKFPSPKRNVYDWDEENLKSLGFKMLAIEKYENFIVFDTQQIIKYLTTQSNIINAVENGNQTISDVEQWLSKQIEPFFPNINSKNEVVFGNWIRYLKLL